MKGLNSLNFNGEIWRRSLRNLLMVQCWSEMYLQPYQIYGAKYSRMNQVKFVVYSL